MIEIIIFYWSFIGFLLMIAGAIYAKRLNRSMFGWTMCSLFVSPIVTFAFLIALGKKDESEQEDHEQVEESEYSDEQCPQCGAELNGVVCPSCKHWVG